MLHNSYGRQWAQLSLRSTLWLMWSTTLIGTPSSRLGSFVAGSGNPLLEAWLQDRRHAKSPEQSKAGMRQRV
eukprot:2023695-Amphidinium_carterae.1